MVRTALVTGGTKGIGAAIMRALEKEGCEPFQWSRANGVDVLDPDSVRDAIQNTPRPLLTYWSTMLGAVAAGEARYLRILLTRCGKMFIARTLALLLS